MQSCFNLNFHYSFVYFFGQREAPTYWENAGGDAVGAMPAFNQTSVDCSRAESVIFSPNFGTVQIADLDQVGQLVMAWHGVI